VSITLAEGDMKENKKPVGFVIRKQLKTKIYVKSRLCPMDSQGAISINFTHIKFYWGKILSTCMV